MKSLKDITLDTIVEILPSDVINDLSIECVKNKLYLPRVHSLAELFSNYLSHNEYGLLNFREMIKDFILNFPLIAKPIENIKDHIDFILNQPPSKDIITNYIGIIDDLGHTFVYSTYSMNIHFLCKFDNIYYGFCLEDVDDFSTHQYVIDFFKKRRIDMERYVTLVKF